jgi:hypothetical protein
MSETQPPPAVIYIIRHAEKPPDPPSGDAAPTASPPPFGVDADGNHNEHSLTPRGWQRSGALALLFDPSLGASEAGLQRPRSLFSPSYGGSSKTAEHRTFQTIEALAGRLGIAIESPFQEGRESDLARSVVANTSGVALICWEHHHIPAIAAALQLVSGITIPASWPDDRFDLIWAFTLTAATDSPEYTFAQIFEQLLSGDGDAPASVN